ncbi:uncharacterized protein LOC141535126 [Cotesia typhae]|uniref:uncharacterized protein LOC141535126 n=1 Tax=Cotesia typhae TaxID=2053667 RepID=UPI003D696EDF
MSKVQEDAEAVNVNSKSNMSTLEKTNALSVIAATYDDDVDENEDQSTPNSEKQCELITREMVVCDQESQEKISENAEPVVLKEITVVDLEPELSIVKEQITLSDCQRQNYRTHNSDSSDSEDDSSSSDSSSSSSSSEAESENEDSDNEKVQSKKFRKKKGHEKGEFDDLPPIEDLQISVPEVLCDPLGEVGWVVEQMVVVTPKANKPTLNFDTILFVDKGKRVLGRVFDVFGPVTEPHYCIRFNNAQHIEESNIKVGMTVYYCPNTPYTTLVFMTDLLKMKASDDVGEDEHPEFSDDEEEKAYYASLKQKQRNNNKNNNNSNSNNNSNNNKSNDTNRSTLLTKRQKKNDGWKSQHPWNSSRRMDQRGQNYYWYQQAQNQSHFYSQPQPQQNMWALYPSNAPGNPPYHYGYQNWYGYPQSQYSAHPSYQQNVNLMRQPGPSFAWQANSTFTPTPTNPSWPILPPPPPPPSPTS